MNKKSFHIVSLGCSKNTVDSDSMAQLLQRAGYRQVTDAHNASILIVNTCGFIDLAKSESYDTLVDLSSSKESGQLLIAAGCLTQRYGDEVARRVPGIDGIIGTRHWMEIVNFVENLRNRERQQTYFHLPEAATAFTGEHGVMRCSVQGASAYLKIADGCRRPCAFCAIPLIKGTAVSRPIELILSEVNSLQKMGVHEIILVAQDTTDYGYDLGLKNGLAHLLEKITIVAPRIDWVRVMYAYPGYVTDKLIEVMATHKQIVHYLDMPLQHAHPSILKRMRRPTNINWIYKTVRKMRQAMPDLALRTTFIVGYPGETEKEFQTLLDFIEELRFDKVGAFKFSFEPGTLSESLGDPIPDVLKEERLRRLMEKQQQISLARNITLINRDLDVLIEGFGQGISVGRTYRDAPEIDGLVLIEGEITANQIIPVHITEAMPYDLRGIAVSKSKMQ